MKKRNRDQLANARLLMSGTSTDLFEPDFTRILPEALPTKVESVFPDQSVLIAARTAATNKNIQHKSRPNGQSNVVRTCGYREMQLTTFEIPDHTFSDENTKCFENP